MNRLTISFFDRDALLLAKALIGKVIVRYYQQQYLYAQITQTEAYYLTDKASHASLGWTRKRHGLFMPPGTIYMYYARGGDSFNVSAQGDGNAVLIKAARPYLKVAQADIMLETMHLLNPTKKGEKRLLNKLCEGQTLLCKALHLKVPEWDQHQFTEEFYLADVGYQPQQLLQTTRCGIPKGRDEHLLYRFVDATLNP
jgi:DNA-3-methyladenine glycosylase